MGVSTTSEKAERKSERCQQVLDAASKCFSQKGFHGTSMSELAKAAGMSVGHIYHYFHNKEAIIAAIVEREVGRQLDRFRELRQEKDVVQGLIDRAAPALARRLDREQAGLWLEVLAEASRNEEVASVIRAADDTLRRTYREVLKDLAASLGLSSIDLGGRVEVLVALFEGMSIRAVRHPDLEPQATLESLQYAIRTLLSPSRPH